MMISESKASEIIKGQRDKIKVLEAKVKLLEKTNKEIKQVMTDFLANMIDDIDNWDMPKK